jgi:hypothetical protein
MRAEEIKGLIEAYSKVHETPEVLSEETEQLDEAPGGPARFWDSNMGKFVTKVSNAAKAAGEYLAPSPERSAEPSVRAGVRTPQTGFSHVASMDRAPTSTARPTRRETPAQREARISRAQDAAIAAADKAEKAKAKPEPGSNRPGPSGTPGGTPSNVISAKNIAGQSQKVTVGRKYGATLGGQKGSVTYDASGKRTFTADKPSTAAEKPTTTPSPSNKPSPSPTPTAKPSAMDQWRKANPKLAAAADEKARIRGTSQTDNPLMKDMRSKMSMTPSVQSPTLAKDLGKGSGNQSLLNNPNASKAAPPKPAATATPKPTAAKPSGFDLAKKGVNLASDVDIFDLVKGHLLDEGYAETEQNAIVMMANMSEEWRNSILETHGVDLEETKKWIQKAIKHPGALHKELGVPEDEKIPTGKLEIAAKKGGKMGKRARLAMTLKGLKKN